MNLKLLKQLYENMGSRYFFYRIGHEIQKRTGKLKRRHPANLKFIYPINKANWINKLEELNQLVTLNLADADNSLVKLRDKAEYILQGNLPFFNAEWINLGKDYDWITNPLNQYKYDISKHWSEIPDFSDEAGDIKYVWEKSRFSWLLPLLRYDHHFKNDLSEFVFSEIDSWIDSNPVNLGPNWRCSQEISLRIFNWFTAIVYYNDAEAFTEERWIKIQSIIFASLHHVYHHIDFSRVAVRNNHAITETLFLTLSEILFPFIPETREWARKGREWFEEEIAYQIYEDGTFLQFSMNYHRVVIQLLTLGISVTEKAGKPFSKIVYDKAFKSLEFLYQNVQDENGWLPNYGSNDGALFFPWTDTDYRNYKPQLNSLHFLLTGQNLYEDEAVQEEIYWWKLQSTLQGTFEPLQKVEGIKEYPNGGYIIIRDKNAFTLIRCGSHKDRPAQADNMHIDIWVSGQNILRDSGTYKYNTTPNLLQYFTGSMSHNTVVVDDQSQMLKGSRFIWFYWTQKNFSKITETETAYEFEGEIKAFQHINKKGRHKRKVSKMKGKNIWTIEDQIFDLEDFEKQQIWHIDNHNIQIRASECEQEIYSHELPSYRSDYYGVKVDGRGIAFKFDKNIVTNLEYPQ